MARAKKRPTKTRKSNSDLEKAAKLAAEEVVDSLSNEEEDMFQDDAPDEVEMRMIDDAEIEASDQEAAEKDIFVDAFKKAQARNDSLRYYIYKNSQFTAIKEHPYDWERLQSEFGEGHYRISARSRKTGQQIMQQSELVGNPQSHVEDETEEVDTYENHQPSLDPFAMITMMSQLQEKSESKAQAQAQAQATVMATMMQTMMQLQTQSQQQFQTMLLQTQQQAQAASQKSQDLVTTLLTTMLSKKDDGGFNAATVLKMIQDAEKTAESRTKEWYRMIEDKSAKLAEEKAELIAASDSEGEESLTKTLVKGFVPLITQMMQQQQQPGMVPMSPEQVQQQRVIEAQKQALMLEQREREERAKRIMEKSRQAQVPQNFVENGARVTNPKMDMNGPGRQTNTVQISQPVIKEAIPSNRGDGMKDKIFDIVKADIGQALLLRKPASKTAQDALKRLEKEGIARQTVLDTFTLEDFFQLAKVNGVPDMAKPWITEFYEYIQKSDKPVRARATARAEVGTTTQNI